MGKKTKKPRISEKEFFQTRIPTQNGHRMRAVSEDDATYDHDIDDVGQVDDCYAIDALHGPTRSYAPQGNRATPLNFDEPSITRRVVQRKRRVLSSRPACRPPKSRSPIYRHPT